MMLKAAPLPPSELMITEAHIIAVGQKDAIKYAKRARCGAAWTKTKCLKKKSRTISRSREALV
jgi:hypothetical protein